MKLRFTCKDPHVARHHEHTFGPTFEESLNAGVVPPEELLGALRAKMRIEAAIQEHYNYVTDEAGRRHVVFHENGIPILLVPTVELVS